MFISFEPVLSLKIYLNKGIKDICKHLYPSMFIVALFVIMKDWEWHRWTIVGFLQFSSTPHPDCFSLDFLMLVNVLLKVWCSEADQVLQGCSDFKVDSKLDMEFLLSEAKFKTMIFFLFVKLGLPNP